MSVIKWVWIPFAVLFSLLLNQLGHSAEGTTINEQNSYSVFSQYTATHNSLCQSTIKQLINFHSNGIQCHQRISDHSKNGLEKRLASNISSPPPQNSLNSYQCPSDAQAMMLWRGQYHLLNHVRVLVMFYGTYCRELEQGVEQYFSPSHSLSFAVELSTEQVIQPLFLFSLCRGQPLKLPTQFFVICAY